MSGSDDGFGTTSTLSVELDERSLTNVKHQIESEIGSMPLGVTDGGSMSAQMAGGGGNGRERRRRRREFRWARERTGYLEDAVTYLEEIEDKTGDDDGGIAGGIINQVIDSGGDAGGAAALSGAAAALTGAATAHTGAAAAHGGAAAALTAAAGAISGAGGSVGIEKPQWVPLAVEDVPPIDVENVPDSVAIEDPSDNYPLESPSGAYPLAEPESPYPVAEPTEPYPVEDVDPIEIEVSLSAQGSGEDRGPVAGEQGNDFIRGIPGIGGPLAEVDRRATNAIRDTGRKIPFLPEPAPPIPKPNQQSSGGQSIQTGAAATQPVDVTVENNSQNEVVINPDVDSIAAEVVDRLEQQLQDNIDQIESDVQDIQDQLRRVSEGGRGP